MKTLAVLALAVFTGCQANSSNSKELHNPRLQPFINAFWTYIFQTVNTSDETSQMTSVSQNVEQTQAPASEDLMTKITKEAEILRQRLEQDLNTMRDKLEPYADHLKSQLEEKVEEVKAAMGPYAGFLNTETLKGSLEHSMKDMQTQLEPFTAELKENVHQYMHEMKESFVASTEDLKSHN